MSWLLEQISIEGFRGINNEGAPLELAFNPDKINSVFAPNGVGKSSIFEAVTYALTGAIPKLDSLPTAERSANYYLNRFHTGDLGTISLTLRPADGGASVTVTVTRAEDGARTVATSDGSDGHALLATLNREFVLLDAKTFQTFIDDKPLDRGRSFAGLLGLGSYSVTRQTLQAISNTRAFNNHFQITARNARKTRAEADIAQARRGLSEAYLALTGEALPSGLAPNDIRASAQGILVNTPLLRPHCEGKTFDQISPDDCLASVREAEGGPDRERLAQLIRAQAEWNGAVDLLPSENDLQELIAIAAARDAALEKTQGDAFLKLYRLTAEILSMEGQDPNSCPACDRAAESSVLDHAHSKIALFDTVTAISTQLAEKWNAFDWNRIAALETSTREGDEALLVKQITNRLNAGTFTQPTATDLQGRVNLVRSRANAKAASLTAEKDALEKRLPPSHVAVTEKVEAARRLQSSLKSLGDGQSDLATVEAEIARIARVKAFLDAGCEAFSNAEAAAAIRRLAAVEPVCREIFQRIIYEPVTPAIAKRAGSEDLSISLATFHHLTDVSAQSLLSESYRNAFAISVYLAAATLYGGDAKFLILDDVTSSLDAGHQFHLMEVLRSHFARPNTPNGPQVIILSHDCLLEKYFNTQGSTVGWSHQRIEGTPHTAVLPQSNAVNRVRDATLALLNAGNVQDAAPRIRQYLEYILEQIIIHCRIPVPIDVAMSDDRRLASHLIGAIDAAVKLYKAAGSLILDDAQVQGLNTAAMTITANFLSHWSTGQTQAYSAGSLLGVMQAVESYADCFKFEPAPGEPRRFYKNLSQR